MKDVFTTGDAAKLLRVSQQTIIRCFDAGELRGFRVPGSRFRRIPRESLLRFMRQNGIPTGDIEGPAHRVLLVTESVAISELVNLVIGHDPRFQITIGGSAFEAGQVLAEWHPELVIVDLAIGEAEHIVTSLRSMPDDRAPHVIALGKGYADELANAIEQALDVDVTVSELAAS